MDDFKFVTLFLVLSIITINAIVPVQSGYAVFQPQYFPLQTLQQPYSPYPFYDIYKVNHDAKTAPSPVYPPGYPSYSQPQVPSYNPRPQVPTVYNYFGTPVYDFRYPGVPFYRGRPVFPPPPLPPGPYDPPSTDKPEKDDGIEKLDKHKADKKKHKKPQKPEENEDTTEPTEATTEPSDDTVTVDALPE